MARKNLFKKVMAAVLAGAMVLSLSACGGGKEEGGSVDTAAESSVSESTDTAEDGEETEDAGEADAPAVEMEDTTINIRIMNEFRNLDKVLAKYEEMTADDPIMSKIHPEFTFVSGGDYKDKLSMALVAQEDYDLMFCGGWHGLSTFIQQGNFADLTSYFGNDAFPGLKGAFSENFVEDRKSVV